MKLVRITGVCFILQVKSACLLAERPDLTSPTTRTGQLLWSTRQLNEASMRWTSNMMATTSQVISPQWICVLFLRLTFFRLQQCYQQTDWLSTFNVKIIKHHINTQVLCVLSLLQEVHSSSMLMLLTVVMWQHTVPAWATAPWTDQPLSL